MELYAAFTLGLFGSLHCVGMCGPLMLAATGKSGWLAAGSYQAGRLLTYLLLGALLGSLGLGMRLWNAQGFLAIFSGVLLVIFALLQLDPGTLLQRWPPFARGQLRLRGIMSRFLQTSGAGARFALGICNGLLPCGLVYLAIIGAANTTGPLNGATFMLAFGLGTLPLLALSLFAGKKLLGRRGDLLRRWTPWLTAIAGILLLWRGYSSQLPHEFYGFQDLLFPPRCH